MPAIDYRRARAQLRLADVLELIAYQLRWRQGEQWLGPCPLHGSRSKAQANGPAARQPRRKAGRLGPCIAVWCSLVAATP